MTQLGNIPPQSRKQIAWWKAGLLGALINLGCTISCFVIANVWEILNLSELFLLASLVVPTLITTAIYTAINSDHPRNRLHTILVALMSGTVPIFAVIWFIAWLGNIFSLTTLQWAKENFFVVIAYFFFTYGSTAIIALVLWTVFGRKVKTVDESF